MTLAMLHAFGARWTREGNTLSIAPAQHSPARMEIEGDLSGACYFYALALLFSTKVRVRHIHADTLQGDRKFLTLLADRGVKFTDSESGLCADGSKIPHLQGFLREYEGLLRSGAHRSRPCALCRLSPPASRGSGISDTRNATASAPLQPICPPSAFPLPRKKTAYRSPPLPSEAERSDRSAITASLWPSP